MTETGEFPEPRELLTMRDFHRIARELKKLADSGEITQRQANRVLKQTPYRLEQKPIFEVRGPFDEG
jgi:hypothetical protein